MRRGKKRRKPIRNLQELEDIKDHRLNRATTIPDKRKEQSKRKCKEPIDADS